jgi:heme/copper-type cytochrome/quinol oxidase subunit 3
MEIPYTVTARPDTGLYNAKLGIWLFLASEVMLFGGLFSAYIFLRLGAEPSYWPHGLLNVPVGTANTAILIASSVTVVLAWASLKMRRWNSYVIYMAITILCGVTFLTVKLAFEWPQKFEHYGVFIRKDSLPKYEEYLGNKRLASLNIDPRVEIAGHLHEAKMNIEGTEHEFEVSSAGQLQTSIDKVAAELRAAGLEKKKAEISAEAEKARAQLDATPTDRAAITNTFKRELLDEGIISLKSPVLARDLTAEEKGRLVESFRKSEFKLAEKNARFWVPKVEMAEVKMRLDELNAEPDSPENDRPHFLTRPLSDKMVTIHGEDIESSSAFTPRHSTYFSTYFLITGLHGLHVLGGVLVFTYLLIFGKKLYLRNPEHMANRVEVSGLFWHFVDLVWIFVFPIFYLL